MNKKNNFYQTHLTILGVILCFFTGAFWTSQTTDTPSSHCETSYSLNKQKEITEKIP
jgi:hypothetical protein